MILIRIMMIKHRTRFWWKRPSGTARCRRGRSKSLWGQWSLALFWASSSTSLFASLTSPLVSYHRSTSPLACWVSRCSKLTPPYSPRSASWSSLSLVKKIVSSKHVWSPHQGSPLAVCYQIKYISNNLYSQLYISPYVHLPATIVCSFQICEESTRSAS